MKQSGSIGVGIVQEGFLVVTRCYKQSYLSVTGIYRVAPDGVVEGKVYSPMIAGFAQETWYR
ncbi:MAG: hypothetical protein JNK86_04300 [Alphaproteobacteria bacterium]|nr:hypothetical protein [Alphaproteobacteria bacterium]